MFIDRFAATTGIGFKPSNRKEIANSLSPLRIVGKFTNQWFIFNDFRSVSAGT